jgi:hypothetical protein
MWTSDLCTIKPGIWNPCSKDLHSCPVFLWWYFLLDEFAEEDGLNLYHVQGTLREWVARDQIHCSLLRNGFGSCFSAFPLFYVKEGHIIVIYKNYIGCLFDFICIFLQLIRTCLVMLNQCYKSWKILEKVVFFISPRIIEMS